MKMFNYSILDMDIKNRDKFVDMASELIAKIDNYKEIFLTPSRLIEYTKGKWIDGVNENLRFTGVGTYGTCAKGNIYFAMAIKDWIKDKKNVSDELRKILSKDIRAIVLDDMQYAPLIDVPIFYVKDTLEAFREVSQAVRQDINPFTVLVTGTEGKTGSKIQFHHILNGQVKTNAVLNSFNTEIPVLRSLINLEEDDKIEINEVSVGSDEDYRVKRAKMVNPDLCFFTNIGPNHMDMHKTIDNIMEAKSSVVEGLKEGGKCILNSTIEYYDKLLKAIDKRRKNIPILTYGNSKKDTAYLISQIFNSDKFGWDVEASIDNEKVKYFLPLFQNHAPLTSVGILLTVKVMGYDVQRASKDYKGLIPFETMGRILKIKKQNKEINFYDQSRRGGIHGMRSAFNDMKNFKIKGRIIALVGGISTKKDTDWTKESHKELALMINDSKIDRLYTTGNFMNYVTDDLNNKDIFVKHSDNLDKLANALYNELQEDDLLFIIGSAYLYLGRVSDRILKLKEKDFSIEEKTSLLFNFFKTLDKAILKNDKFFNVNEDIKKTGGENFIYSQEFCKRWFNNFDKIKTLPRKQLFGSFYFLAIWSIYCI
jgi:UDP-N-acetylmuramoyl-tripeptide--D-alanyl-D-alanine ligase